MTAQGFIKTINKLGDDVIAAHSQRFFKTGPGHYGEGDQFIGVRVPVTRGVCKLFKELPLDEVQKLLNSPIHEHRLGAVIILANRYKKSDETHKQKIYDFYIKNVYSGRINNWDIVDTSAGYIIGDYLFDKPRDQLFELAKSDDIWQRRVSIISTYGFIMKGDPATTLEIAELLMRDKHDLIHKASGWMLREMGKRIDTGLLLEFLDNHAHEMPRTMLRYAIEQLPQNKRKYYMNK